MIPRQVPNPRNNGTYFATIVETLTGGEIYNDYNLQLRNYLERVEGRQAADNAVMFSYDGEWVPNGSNRGTDRIVRADLGYVVYTFATSDHYRNFTYLFKTYTNDEL